MRWLENNTTHKHTLCNTDSVFCGHKYCDVLGWNDSECSYNHVILSISKRSCSAKHIIYVASCYRPDYNRLFPTYIHRCDTAQCLFYIRLSVMVCYIPNNNSMPRTILGYCNCIKLAQFCYLGISVSLSTVSTLPKGFNNRFMVGGVCHSNPLNVLCIETNFHNDRCLFNNFHNRDRNNDLDLDLQAYSSSSSSHSNKPNTDKFYGQFRSAKKGASLDNDCLYGSGWLNNMLCACICKINIRGKC